MGPSVFEMPDFAEQILNDVRASVGRVEASVAALDKIVRGNGGQDGLSARIAVLAEKVDRLADDVKSLQRPAGPTPDARLRFLGVQLQVWGQVVVGLLALVGVVLHLIS